MSLDSTSDGSSDPFSAYLSAYLQGRAFAKQRRQGALLSALDMANSEGGGKALGFSADLSSPFTGGGADRWESGSGEPGLHVPAHDLIGRLPDNVQKVVLDHANILTAFVQGLSHYPYPERLEMLRHAAPYLTRLGFRAEEVTAFDPTDANLEEVSATAAHVLRSPDIQRHLSLSTLPR